MRRNCVLVTLSAGSGGGGIKGWGLRGGVYRAKYLSGP